MKKTITRRDMIATAAKTTVGAVAGASMAVPTNAAAINPDAKLIALYAGLLRERAILQTMDYSFPEYDSAKWEPIPDEHEAAFGVQHDKTWVINKQILPIPAHTAQGVRIKLDVWWYNQSNSFPDGVDWVDNLVVSAFEDLKRFAPIEVPANISNEDGAKLHRPCEAVVLLESYKVAHATYEAKASKNGDTPADKSLMDNLLKSEKQMLGSDAATIEGLVAQVEFLKLHLDEHRMYDEDPILDNMVATLKRLA